MIDKEKTYRTRDGRKARVLATDVQSDSCVIAAVQNLHGMEVIYRFNENGMYYDEGDEESPYDLIEVKPSYSDERWFNIYTKHWVMFTTREQAIQQRTTDCLATRHVVLSGPIGEDDA